MKTQQEIEPEKWMVKPYHSDGQTWWEMVRVYKSKTWANKYLNELANDYEVNADLLAWYPDFSKSKGGRFELKMQRFAQISPRTFVKTAERLKQVLDQ